MGLQEVVLWNDPPKHQKRKPRVVGGLGLTQLATASGAFMILMGVAIGGTGSVCTKRLLESVKDKGRAE